MVSRRNFVYYLFALAIVEFGVLRAYPNPEPKPTPIPDPAQGDAVTDEEGNAVLDDKGEPLTEGPDEPSTPADDGTGGGGAADEGGTTEGGGGEPVAGAEPGAEGEPGADDGKGQEMPPSGGAGKGDCPRRTAGGTCITHQMDPFHKPNLRERLEFVLKPIPPEQQDPRFPIFAELHSKDLLPNIRPIIPRADVDFLRLHYDSRGDYLPQVKRLDERPGPLYSFQGQGAPCDPNYTFERWPGEPDVKAPPKKPGYPDKPLRTTDLCIRN